MNGNKVISSFCYILHSMNFLSVQGISKHYQSGENTVAVLSDLSLEMHKGEMVMVMGPSGSGKTTLMNAIGGDRGT